MRVLQVINGLGTGGAERSLAEFIPRAAAAGVEVEVVCLHRREEGIEDTEGDIVQRARFLAGSTWSQRVAEVRRIVVDTRPDVVHTTIFEADVIGRLAAARLAPVLTSLVNTSYEPARLGDPNVRRSRLAITRTIDSVTGRLLTDHFHAITHAVKRSAVRRLHLPADRITVIPRGRDAARLGEQTPERRADARRALGLDSDQRVILNVGRQEFQKGQIHLIRALAHLATPDALLVQAGRSGNASTTIHDTVAASGLADRVRFVGHHVDVPGLLSAADVFAFPSVYEGLGGSVLEAMALGIPIVASDIPAVREILADGECGLLVPPGDERGFASAIDHVFADPVATQQRALAAKARFDTHHELGRVTEAMLELYHRVGNRR